MNIAKAFGWKTGCLFVMKKYFSKIEESADIWRISNIGY